MPDQNVVVYRWLHLPTGEVGMVLICRDLPTDVVMFVPWHAVTTPEIDQRLQARLLPANQFRRILITAEAPIGFSHNTTRKVQP